MNLPTSPERRLSPELARKIQERWGIVYTGVEEAHQILEIQDNAVSRSRLALAPELVQEINAAPVAGVAIDGVARQEQAEQVALTQQEQAVYTAQQEVVEAIGSEIIIPKAEAA